MIGNLQHFFDRFVVLGDKLATKGADSWFRYYLQQKMSGNARAHPTAAAAA